MSDELRAAILADPASRGARRVYADWLIEQGDPRGEWIALHDNDSDEAELKRRALWQVHGAKWRAEDSGLGPDARTLDQARYVGGLLEDVRVHEKKLYELAPALAKQPIRTLGIYDLETLEPVAALPVLQTVDHLELGYGLQDTSAQALRAVLEATPRLTALTLSPHEDVDFAWEALEGFSRLGALEKLDVSSIMISKERAKWLAGALPKLKTLRWSSGLSDAALEVFAAEAAFKLTRLYLSDRDGHPDRPRLMTDGVVATVLQSSFCAELEVLSLFGSDGRSQVADALGNLPCADKLTGLDLGSMESPRCVRALSDATLPKLTWLSVRHNYASDGDLEALAHLSTVTTLRAEKNMIGHEGVKTVIEAMPNLVSLSIGDNALGNHGVLAIAYGAHAAKLRHLEISSTQCSTDAVEALIECGNLTELRSLELACNESIKRAGIQALADGPFDKLELLSLTYIANSDIAPLFADSWLPAERSGEDKYQRKLALDGTAVPHKRKQKKKKKTVDPADARPIDDKADYKKGEHVKHTEMGVGLVTEVKPLALHVKFPRHGAYVFARTPANAIPFSIKERYALDQIVVHPKFGAGIVVGATSDKVEIEFGVGGKRTLIHGK